MRLFQDNRQLILDVKQQLIEVKNNKVSLHKKDLHLQNKFQRYVRSEHSSPMRQSRLSVNLSSIDPEKILSEWFQQEIRLTQSEKQRVLKIAEERNMSLEEFKQLVYCLFEKLSREEMMSQYVHNNKRISLIQREEAHQKTLQKFFKQPGGKKVQFLENSETQISTLNSYNNRLIKSQIHKPLTDN